MNLRFLILPGLPLTAYGQCSMCFRSAAALDAHRQQALNLGILVLLLPPLFFLASLLYLAWRRDREQGREDVVARPGRTGALLITGAGQPSAVSDVPDDACSTIPMLADGRACHEA